MAGRLTSLTREQVRAVDQRAIDEFHLPGIVLMENAGRGCAELLHDLGIVGPVVICCGKGNNGGDGYVIARHLENSGVDVTVLVVAAVREIGGDARVNLNVLQAAGTPVRCLAGSPALDDWSRLLRDADWIVDALLGTGAHCAVREPYGTAIEAINRARARVLAVDLPSGLDCDTGIPLGPCVRAEHTATFVAAKKGFEHPGAVEFTGRVHVLDIGAPRRLLTSIGL